jgi:hypothetical protein
MKNQKTSLASKIAIVGILLITAFFFYACYNSVKETKETCSLALGTQTLKTK